MAYGATGISFRIRRHGAMAHGYRLDYTAIMKAMAAIMMRCVRQAVIGVSVRRRTREDGRIARLTSSETITFRITSSSNSSS